MLTPEDFLGEWIVDRFIDDRYSGQTGSFQGKAWVTAATPSNLIYRETGEMQLGQAPCMTATRSYGWAFRDGKVVVSFDDGRPSHSFVPDGVGAGTDHPCGDDFYKVLYNFVSWPAWSAVWTVEGPRKDYTSTTQYRHT